jgi:proton-translocating NADH-quinone oxidoreductase chain N
MMSVSPLLPIVTLLVGAIVSYLFARLLPKPKYTGFVSLIFLVISGIELFTLYPGTELITWSIGNAQTYLQANSLAIFLGLVAVGLGALVSLFSIGYMEHSDGLGRYYGLLLIMIAGIVGIGLAGDLFNLFVFFEVMAIPSYVLVAFEKEKWEPIEAAMKYIIMSVFGSLIALMGISIIFMYTGSLELATLAKLTAGMDSLKAIGAVGLIILGFGVKAAIVPLHTWLPDAHSAAPSGISAMLSGIIIESGLITMIKALAVLPEINSGVVLIIFGIVSMFVGNFMAIVQRDLKRMLAYSSIAQMGYILLGVGLAFAYLSTGGDYGFRGGIFHILNHAVMKGGAFLCAGAILHSIGTRDLEEMRGIGRKLPLVGVAFAFFGLALAGVPPLNGFISKFFICKAGVDVGGWGIVATVLLIVNSVLSLCYYLPAINRILFSRDISEKVKEAKGIPPSMSIPIIIMVILTVALGVYPELGLKVVNPVVSFMMASLGGS